MYLYYDRKPHACQKLGNGPGVGPGIGSHNLKIETGRFTIPKTPEDLRICDHCYVNSA